MNINPELYLIRFLFDPKQFAKYGSFLESKFLKDNSPELHRLLQTVTSWHQKYPDTAPSMEEYVMLYETLFPSVSEKEDQILKTLFSKLEGIQVEEAVAVDYLTSHVQRARATATSLLALEVAEGRKPFDALRADLEALDAIADPAEAEENPFVELAEDGERPPPGLRWRLNSLNRSLGSLRKGNNGFIFARPEAGKTSLVCAESTFMAEQLAAGGVHGLEGPVLVCSNEQPGEEVMTRAVCASLGISQEQFFKYRKQALNKFKQKTGGLFLLFDKGSMEVREVEKLTKRYGPALIVFDQLDNIKGFNPIKERADLSLRALYQWARELSKEYGPVISVCQAGGTAEGKKWLTMDDVDGSKTAKQGAADWIIGMGHSHQAGLENIRHISLSKNKLMGDEDTDPSMRHGRFDIRILPLICRFEDV